MNRKHLIVLLGLIAACSLTACSTNDKKTETEAKTEAAANKETEAATEAKADDAEAGTEAKADDAEAATEAKADDAEADTEVKADDVEAVTEAKADDAEAGTEAEEEVLVIGEDETENAEEEVLVLGEDETVSISEDETEVQLAPVTPSDYLIKDVDQYVTLGDLEGLEVTRYIYEITDDMVEEYIQYDLDMYSEEVDVDRASQADDIVYLDLTSSIQGSDEEPYTESTYFTVGYEEYGAEFDEKLTGVKAGDHLEFTITFGDEIWMEEWIGQTVDFTADITAVSELNIPEYNEAFVQEYTDYETVEEYEESIRESLTAEYDEISYTDTIDALLEAAVAKSEFSSYPPELYDSCKAEILSFYAAFAGTSEEEEIYEMFGISEADIQSDVEYYVYRRILVSAICEQNNLELTEADYFAYLEENAPYYEYESAADFETDYTRETLIWSLYESMAADVLYESAKVTEETYQEDLLYDEEYAEEDFEDDTAGEEEELLEEDAMETEDFLDEDSENTEE